MLSNKITLLVATGITFFLAISLIIYFPSTTPLSPFNVMDNGMSTTWRMLGLEIVQDMGEINSTGAIILPLNRSLTNYEQYKEFVRGGGILILLDTYGYSNEFLKKLGLESRINNLTVLDEISKYEDRFHIKASSVTHNLSLALYMPSFIELLRKEDILAMSSRYSYVDRDRNWFYTPGDSLGKHPVAASIKVGEGKIILIADLNFLTNKMVSLGNNIQFIDMVLENRSSYLDLSGIDVSPIDRAKVLLHTLTQKYNYWVYSLLPLSIISFLGGYIWNSMPKKRWSPKKIYVASLTVLAVSALIYLESGDPMIVALALVTASLIGMNMQNLSIFSLTATLLYGALIHSSIGGIGGALYFLLFPIIAYNFLELDPKPTGFLGPASRASLSIGSMYIPLIVINPGLSLIFLFLYLGVVGWSLYGRVRAKKARINRFLLPGKVQLGMESQVILWIKGESVYIHVTTDWGVKHVELVNGEKEFRLPYTSRNIGSLPVFLSVHSIDSLLLSSFRLASIEGRVNVIPSTDIRVSEIKKYFGEALLAAGPPRRFGFLGYGGVRGFGRGFSSALSLRKAFLGLSFIGAKGKGKARGTYYGVREFVPGDTLRDIHWKKTISRRELYVKTFEDGGEGGRGGAPLIIITDLLAANVEELDEITRRTLMLLYRTAIGKIQGRELLLIVISPIRELIYAVGTPEQVLNFFLQIYEKGMVKLFYNYKAFLREIDTSEIYEFMGASGNFIYFGVLNDISMRLAKKVLEALVRKEAVEAEEFVIIHGAPSAVTVRYVEELLELSGLKRSLDYALYGRSAKSE